MENIFIEILKYRTNGLKYHIGEYKFQHFSGGNYPRDGYRVFYALIALTFKLGLTCFFVRLFLSSTVVLVLLHGSDVCHFVNLDIFVHILFHVHLGVNCMFIVV